MAGQLPTSPAFAGITIKNNQPNITTISTSGRRQVKSQQTQFWSFNAAYPAMKRSDWAPIAAFIAKQRGSTESFTVVLPEYSYTQGNLTTQTVSTVNNETAGATQIEVTSSALTQTDSLKAGDFIRFKHASDPNQGYNKVYMVTDDVDFASGQATINIEPGLTSDVAAGYLVQYNGVEFTVFLPNDVQEFNTGLGNMVEYELEMREAL